MTRCGDTCPEDLGNRERGNGGLGNGAPGIRERGNGALGNGAPGNRERRDGVLGNRERRDGDLGHLTPANGLVPGAAPGWLAPLVRASRDVGPELFGERHAPKDGRPAAVLVLFGWGPAGPDLLLQRRASTLRSHAGQVSFPGGAVDPGDGGPVGTALREAAEETGLDPTGVDPLAVLPELFIPPSGFLVTPVLAHWRQPVAVAPVDKFETAEVVRVPVAELADPANRIVIRHPSGWTGPAFEVAGLVVWGFTGGLVDALLRLGGWERRWSAGRVREYHEVIAAELSAPGPEQGSAR